MNYIDFLQKNNQERLFPELEYKEKGGYGDVVSKWFTRYTKKIGVYEKNTKVFHSLSYALG